jgi:hypothetical protein
MRTNRLCSLAKVITHSVEYDALLRVDSSLLTTAMQTKMLTLSGLKPFRALIPVTHVGAEELSTSRRYR